MIFSPNKTTRYFKCHKDTSIYKNIKDGFEKVLKSRKECQLILDEIGAYGAAYYSNSLTPCAIFGYKENVTIPEYMRKNKNGYYQFNLKNKIGKEYSQKWKSIEKYSRYAIIDQFINPNDIFNNAGYVISNNFDFYYFVINCLDNFIKPDELIEISNLEFNEIVEKEKTTINDY